MVGIVSFVITIVSALVVAGAGVAFLDIFYRRGRQRVAKSFGAQLSDLTKRLADSSTKIDDLIDEMARVSRERESAIRTLGTELTELESREQQTRERIDALENVSISVADHLVDLMQPRENQAAKRGLVFFISGAVFSSIVTVVVQIFI